MCVLSFPIYLTTLIVVYVIKESGQQVCGNAQFIWVVLGRGPCRMMWNQIQFPGIFPGNLLTTR